MIRGSGCEGAFRGVENELVLRGNRFPSTGRDSAAAAVEEMRMGVALLCHLVGIIGGNQRHLLNVTQPNHGHQRLGVSV